MLAYISAKQKECKSIFVDRAVQVLDRGPYRKLHLGPPLFASKMEGKGGFTQNAIFIRLNCISCIFVRFLMNEPDEYVFTQNAIASDVVLVVVLL